MALSLTILLLLGQSQAASLESAKAQLKALKFEPALELAASALASGGATAEETVELHFVMGQAAAVLGRADEAQDSFARALELQPGLTLPPGASPRLADPFRAAARQLDGRRLTASPSSEQEGASLARIKVTIDGDAKSLFAKGSVRHGFPASPTDTPLAATRPPEATIACAQPPCPFTVTLFDFRGNTLLQVGTEAQPLFTRGSAPVAVTAVEPPLLPEVKSEPIYKRPLPYLIAAGALAATSGVLAWRFADAQSRLTALEAGRGQHRFSEAQAVDSERQALRAATIGCSVAAGAFGVVAVAVW